jgi:hypothetical protein
MQNFFRELTIPGIREDIAFEIVRSKEEGAKENDYFIADGVCYSTFSFETGSFLKISGLNKPFTWEKNQKVYIEIEVGTNLGVKKASIKNELVGKDAPEGGWANYPYFYKIEPQDVFSTDVPRRVLRLRDGKRQLKCYALIGYLDNDEYKNGTDDIIPNSSSSSSVGSPVQILKENIILVPTTVSGVPCVAPFPYFMGGLTHLLTIKEDQLSSSSSSSSSNNNSSSSSNTQ